MRLARLAQILGVVVGEHEFADEIEEQSIEYVETVRIVHEISEQDVVLEEQMFVVAAFHEEESVLEDFDTFAKYLRRKARGAISQACLLPLRARYGKCFANLAE